MLLYMLIIAVMQEVRMAQCFCLLALTIALMITLSIHRPFKYRLNNFRVIVIHLMLTALFVVDTALIGASSYSFELEMAAIILVLAILCCNLLILVAQITNSYSE